MIRQRAYVHAHSIVFVPWLLIEATVRRVLADARGIARTRHH